jgi:hypothetical protein
MNVEQYPIFHRRALRDVQDQRFRVVKRGELIAFDPNLEDDPETYIASIEAATTLYGPTDTLVEDKGFKPALPRKSVPPLTDLTSSTDREALAAAMKVVADRANENAAALAGGEAADEVDQGAPVLVPASQSSDIDVSANGNGEGVVFEEVPKRQFLDGGDAAIGEGFTAPADGAADGSADGAADGFDVAAFLEGNVETVVKGLAALSINELAAVRDAEAVGKKRKGVREALDELLGG